MASRQYRAFISYSHRDSEWADWLHKGLEKYRPPKPLIGTSTAHGEIPRRLSPIFKDRDELPSATDLGALINAALADSAAQIVICSPAAAKSKWVNEEILAFKRLGREDRIFCLIVDGEPNASDQPGREDEECFPPALRFRLAPDGQLGGTRTEPIAADGRHGKDGKNNAQLKLIAGLLGVGFDTLRRREQQRRNRRLFVFSCATAAGMVLTTALAAYALIQRSAARRQTVRAAAEARAAKETTRFLVDLFKISDPSEARGSSVTAREMLDKGALRINGELAKVPAIQATLMDTLGSVYMGLGLYAEARPLLDRAVDTRRSLEPVEPANLSQSLSHQGDLLFSVADYPAAEKSYQEAIHLQATLPHDVDTRVQLAESLHGLGRLQATEGHYADAEKNLREALTVPRDAHGESDPTIARTLKDLARTLADDGDLNSAIPLMRKAVAMQRDMYGNGSHPDLAEALNDMGVLLWRRGDLDEAEAFYRESLAMKRRLLGEKHPEIAAGLENVAMSLQDKGDLAGAESLYRQSLEMRRETQGANHPEVGRTLLNLASLQYDRGETGEALVNMRDVLAIYRKAYPADHPETARVLNVIGFWRTISGDYDDADRYLNEALAMRRRLFDEHQPDLASSLMMTAILRDAEGKYPEALELAQSARRIDTEALSADHWRTAIAESAEGAALAGLGRYPEAEILLTHANDILSKNSGAPLIYRTLLQRYLVSLHRGERKTGGAERTTLAKQSVPPIAPTVGAAQPARSASAPQNATAVDAATAK